MDQVGTNYYLRQDECQTCHRCDEDDKIHIGKNSGGWQFLLHSPPPYKLPEEFLTHIGYARQTHFEAPERELRPIKSWQDWKRFLNWAFFEAQMKNAAIRDEYGAEILVVDFVRLVEETQSVPDNKNRTLEVKTKMKNNPRWNSYNFGDWIDDEGYNLNPGEFS